MREVQSSDAKARFAELLDAVEHGETVVITRHGRPVARLVPEPDRRQAEIDHAIAGIKAVRRRIPPVPLDEVLAWRHEGHRF